jgi:hypothetical protein
MADLVTCQFTAILVADAIPGDHRWTLLPGQPCCRRKAFITTNSELSDIPMAAPHGGIQPAAANGTATRL